MGQTNSTLQDYDPRQYRNDVELELSPLAYADCGNYTAESMPLAELAALPQQEQMRFSDAITRRYALNAKFLQMQEQCFHQYSFEYLAQHANEASIGNMAFIAHWNPVGFWQRQYEALLAELRKPVE